MIDNPAVRIGQILRERAQSLSAAESCTAGRISHMIASVPGASDYYLGSVTSYAVSIKERVLGVTPETIQKYGVVSSEVAAAMAVGVRKLTGSDYSVSTTGLAGPGGDGFNPEGTVWIGVSKIGKTKTFCKHFDCGREQNIENFATSALEELLKLIEE